MDCFAKSFFQLVCHQPRCQLLQPTMAETMSDIESYVRMSMKTCLIDKVVEMFLPSMAGFPTEHEPASRLPLATSEKDIFPLILVISGSTFVGIKVSDTVYHLYDADHCKICWCY